MGGWRRLSYLPVAYFREASGSRPSGRCVRQLYLLSTYFYQPQYVQSRRVQMSKLAGLTRYKPRSQCHHSLHQRHDRTINLHVGWLWKRFIKRKLSAILIRTLAYTSHGEARRYWPRAVGKYCRISRRWRPGGCYLLVCGTVECETSLPPPSDTSFILLADMGQLVIRRL